MSRSSASSRLSPRTARNSGVPPALTSSDRLRRQLEQLEDRRLFAVGGVAGLREWLQQAEATGANIAVGDVNGDSRPDIAVAGGFGAGPRARVFDGALGTVLTDRFYGATANRGGADIALADTTGDGLPELIVGSGAGEANEVRVYNPQTGALLRSFTPFGRFTGGVHVAAADVTGDQRADLIVTPGAGGGAIVALFDGSTGAALRQFAGGPEAARGGLSVAAADFDADGQIDIAVGDGFRDGNHVRIYKNTGGAALADFAGIADAEFRGGVTVAAGDVNGDGRPDLAVGTMITGGPRVAVFDGTTLFSGAPMRFYGDFFAADSALRGGTTVVLADLDGDGQASLLTAGSPMSRSTVAVYQGRSSDAVGSFSAFGDAALPTSLITAANTAPTIADLPDQTATAGTTIGPLSVVIGDRETVATALTLTGTSSNSTLLTAEGILLGGTGATRTVRLTPTAGQTGTATITLTVRDAGGRTASDTFVVTVSAAATDTTAPTIALSTPTAANPTTRSNLTATGTATDDRSGVTLEGRTNSGAFAVIPLNADGTFTFTSTLALDGTADGANSITLRARDAAGNLGSPTTVIFTLDTQPPTVTLMLAAESDSSPVGDTQTTAAVVTLRGTTDPGLSVRLGGAAGPVVTAEASGVFNFTNVALALGSNAFIVTATDAAGNSGTASATFTRIAANAPQFTLALAGDTGRSATDRVTNAAAVTGHIQLADGSPIASLTAGLGNASPASFASFLDRLTNGTDFTLSAAQLDSLPGGPAADGTVTLRMIATDANGQSSGPIAFTFTLDRQAPTPPTLSLAPTGATTTAATATLIGTAEPASIVTLRPGGQTATAARDGSFSFTAVALAIGANDFSVEAADLAGNTATSTRTITRTATPAPVLSLHLGTDTGSSATDGLTSDPTLQGTVTVSGHATITALTAGLGTTAVADFANIIDTYSGSTFTLSPARLATLAGGTLADGPLTVRVRATDSLGVVSDIASLTFTLDRIAPAAPTLTLANGTLTTTDGSVTLIGTTDANAAVRLSPGTATATANTAGAFTFPAVALALGANAFTVVSRDAAGNEAIGTRTITRTVTAAPTMTLALATDTGTSATDNLTADPGVRGTVTPAGPATITALTAGLGTTAAADFANIFDTLGGDTFTLTAARLATIAGSALVDGALTVRVRATDSLGVVSDIASLTFTLDRTAPAAATLTLSDGTLTTAATTATLIGTTEANATVRLTPGPLTATADASGAFSLPAVALTLGANVFTIVARDAAGNETAADRSITRSESTVTTGTAPARLAPASNTGRSATANFTRFATPGLLLDAPTGTEVEWFRDGTSVGTSTAVAGIAAFTLPATLDGAHAITARRGPAGAVSVGLTITIDTAAPSTATLDLSAASQSTAPRTTTASLVTLQGVTEADALVQINGVAPTALAANDGRFSLANVPVALGSNVFIVTATDAAGNVLTVTATAITREAAPVGQSDAVLSWVDATLTAINTDASTPPVATRAMAMIFGAMNDAVAAVEGRRGFYLTKTGVPAETSAAAAVTAAADAVLRYLYPVQAAAFDVVRSAALGAIPEGAAKASGLALGTAIAADIIAQRAADGFDAFRTYATAGAAGQWVPTPPVLDEPQLPQWATLRPFAMAASNQYRLPAPPSLTDPVYAASLNEIQSLGRRDSTTRTAEQTQIARFWADGAGSATPPGHWVNIARQVAASKGNSLSANARLMAMLGVGLADAAIAAWDVKYTYGLWRPITAIRGAAGDGNPDTTADAAWESLITTPNHPEYASGHSTFSAAAATILASVFTDATPFSTTSQTLPGVTRSYAGFSAAAAEAGRSRVFGGIHFEFTNQASQTLGRNVAQRTLDAFSTTQDRIAPTVTLAAPPAATNVNRTLLGRVQDNLTGVKSLTLRIDGGAATAVAFAADGSFSVPTSFATDGTADGPHAFEFTATDFAGNIAPVQTETLLLATKSPTLALTAPAANAALTTASHLVGSISGSAANITAIAYQFAGQPAVSLSLDANGKFDQVLDISRLALGSPTLTITARDAAGNTATTTRTLSLTTATPFAVKAVSPAAGTADIGVTQRPQIFFTRPANPATLNAETIYLTDASGSKLAGTVVPANDGSFAWFYPAAPLPGSSRVRLTVKGDSILDAAGANLDADSDGTAGGAFTAAFTTVGRDGVSGTNLSGVVADPGVDLRSGTVDDLGPGPDGSLMTGDDLYKKPIVHAKVYVLGRESQYTFTDAQGQFTLSDLPAGTVKLVIDGHTATNSPGGFYFPEMVMDLTLDAGRAATVMGSMGSAEERRAAAAVRGVYLPRILTASLKTITASMENPVTIGLDSGSAIGLTPEQRAQLTLTVPANSFIGEDGQKLDVAQVGVSTVPPDLVRDMLPPGLLQHTFDITIQAPGVVNFSEPLRMTFPNVFHAAPGTKLNFLSFDHTTGRLVIEGTATVTADGLSAVTDAGSGITKPGWHGLTPPGSKVDGQPPKDPKEPLDCNQIHDTLTNDYNSKKGSAAGPLAHQLACLSDIACQPGNAGWGGPGTWVNDTIQHFTQERISPGLASSLPNLFDLPGYVAGGVSYPPVFTASEELLKSIPDWIPTPVPVPGTPFTLPLQSGDLGAVLGGFGRHFPYELLPSFIRNADHLEDTAPDGTLMHDHLFDDAIVPCFQMLADAGEVSPFAAAVAQKVVPITAALLRKTIVAINNGFNFLSSLGDSLIGNRQIAGDSIYAALPAPLTQAQLYSSNVAAVGNLRVTATNGSFFQAVGTTPQLRVVRQNSDGTTTDVSSAASGTKYFAVVSDGSVTTTADGKLSITSTLSPLANMTPGMYVVVRNGDDFGIGQFAVTDVDSDGDLLVDSYERSVGRDPNIADPIAADRDHDGVKDLFEAFLYSDPNNSDTDRDGVSDLQELKNGGDPTLRGDLESTKAASPLFYRLDNLDSGTVLRGRTSADGGLPDTFLANNANYKYSVFNLESRTTGSVRFTTGASGATVTIPTIALSQSSSPDTDGDGLKNDAEAIIGTSPALRDTDHDGISDLAALQQGIDPLGGRGLPTGVVGALTLRGESRAVALVGSTLNAEGQTAYVATGSAGLAIVNASRFTQPVVQAQLELPGTTVDVAVDAARGYAAVAAGFDGLHVVDVSVPTAAVLLRSVALPYAVTAVQVHDGLAYVADGRFLTSIDLRTGEIVQSLDLAGGDLTGLARDGNLLYTVDAARKLRVVDLADFAMTARGSIILPRAAGAISVANGIVYAIAADNNGGYSTVDVSNPDALSLISAPDGDTSTAYANGDVVPNGSGLAIAVGETPFGNFRGLDLFDARDTSKTAQFLTRINLPTKPFDIALGAGIAFVATGASGLQVVNYLGFDTAGKAPTVAITGPAGTTLTSGANVPVQVAVTDDVQVRNVELLVNGAVTANDVAVPFDLNAAAPAFVAGSTNTFTLQVRATDTGGNITTSKALTYTVVADTVPPALVGSAPAANQAVFFTPSIDLRFDRPLDGMKLAGDLFHLVKLVDGAAAVPVALSKIDLLGLGRRVALYPAANLDTGRYRLTASAAGLVSRSGTAATGDVVLEFEIRTASDIHPLSGTPAIPRAPAANVGQALELLVGWSPKFTQTIFATNLYGTPETAVVAPSKTDDAEQSATVTVPAYAATGDFTTYAQSNFGFTRLTNWTATRGLVDIYGLDAANGSNSGDLLPGNGQYVDLAGNNGIAARLESRTAYALATGDYTLSFRLAGSQRGDANSVTVSLGTAFSETFTRASKDAFTTVTRTIAVPADGSARIAFDSADTGGNGILLDDVKLVRAATGAVLLDDNFLQVTPGGAVPLQIVPTVSFDTLEVGGQYRGDTLSLQGTGFITDKTAINFGDKSNAGAVYGYYDNNYLYATVPAAALSGPITVTTDGGTSTAYPLAVAGLQAQAARGTSTDAGVQSANPGQAVTITGLGLTLNSNILVTAANDGGALYRQVIAPIAADTNGTQATFILPTNAVTGDVEVIGDQTSRRYPLQVVPLLDDVRIVSATATTVTLDFQGSGLIDDGTTYRSGAAVVVDTAAASTADVYNGNRTTSVTFDRSDNLWLGNIRISTAGGTSAPFAFDPLTIASTAFSGTPAVANLPSANPGQIISLTGAAFSEDTRIVVEGPTGYGFNRAVLAPIAVRADGMQASFQLPQDIAGRAVVSRAGTSATAILQIVPLITGVSRSGTSLTVQGRGFYDGDDFTTTAGGLDLLDSDNINAYGFTVYYYNVPDLDPSGTVVVRTPGGTSPAVPLAGVPAAGTPTLGSAQATAQAGTPINAALAAANVGQTLTLSGTHFTLGTRVMFPTRQAANLPATDTVTVAAVSADGTKAQVQVPGFAVTGPVTLESGTGSAPLQIVPTLTRIDRGSDGSYQLIGSGFPADDLTIRVGGLTVLTPRAADIGGSVSGARNGTYGGFHVPFGLDGPVEIRTSGGSVHLDAAALDPTTISYVSLTGMTALAPLGIPTDAAVPSANPGQDIFLRGGGFTAATRVRFDGVDQSGTVGSITRTGTVLANGTILRVTVPTMARTGRVVVEGAAGTGLVLQVVPLVRGVGGSFQSGQSIVLEGAGLLARDVAVLVGGQPAAINYARSLPTSETPLSQQLVEVEVPADIAATTVEVRTAGGSFRYRVGATLTALPDRAIGIDPADTLIAARAVDLPPDSRIVLTGCKLETAADVDLFRVRFEAGDRIQVDYARTDTGLNGATLRLFDASGKSLSESGYTNAPRIAPYSIAAAGDYYIGISGYANGAYNPTLPGSGTGANSTAGSYKLTFSRMNAGSTSLTGITSPSLEGTPARATVAAANTNQTITLTGSGFLSADFVVFEYDPAYYGVLPQISATTVSPLSVAADGMSLTVRVPASAVTGTVHLAREESGAVLQIVPTLATVTVNGGGAYRDGDATVTGTGFASGNTRLHFGAASRGGDVGTYAYSTAYGHIPFSAESGPLTVSTPGGTSRVYGLSFDAIGSTAASGVPADAAVASANPGQAITLTGSGFTIGSDVVFRVSEDYTGIVREYVRTPLAVAADGTSMVVVVPTAAVTDVIEVVGDRTARRQRLQIVPIVSEADFASIDSGGKSSTLNVRGFGFQENASYYILAGVPVDDGGPEAEVFNGNREAYVTVPLGSGNWHGALTVRTPGGTSAPFTHGTVAITATASLGMPNNPGSPAANAGQAFTLTGTGFTTGTRVYVAAPTGFGTQRILLAPSWINAAATQAEFMLPLDVAGIAAVGLVGAADELPLQIVPQITQVTRSGNSMTISGRGFADAGASYSIGGLELADSDNIAAYGNVIYLGNLPGYDPNGTVVVHTPGGSSPAVAVDGVPDPGTGTISGLVSSAVDGVPLDAALPSANNGQTLTVVGTHLTLNTRVRFPIRNNDTTTTQEQTVRSVSADGTRASVAVPDRAATGPVDIVSGSGSVLLQIVPTLVRGTRNAAGAYTLSGSGFEQTLTSVTIGGRTLATGVPQTGAQIPGVSGSRNDTMTIDADLLSLDGPVVVRTPGGTATLAEISIPAPSFVEFTDWSGSPALGTVSDSSRAAANTGQLVTLRGRGLTTETVVRFPARDPLSGVMSTVSVTGSVAGNGTLLTVAVPALAISGNVAVRGAAAPILLQIVPTIRAFGGTLSAGETLILDGTGFAAADLAITLDGLPAAIARRLAVGARGDVQMILDVTVPAGVIAGTIAVASSGGSFQYRRGVVPASAADVALAGDAADSIANAATIAADADAVTRFTGPALATPADVDLYRIALSAGERVTIEIQRVDTQLNGTTLRLFQPDGAPADIAQASQPLLGDFTVPVSGLYTLGVSGYSNTDYDPTRSNSGSGVGSTAGPYRIVVRRLRAGSSTLTGMTATAATGTPASAGLPAANPGQLITLTGSGFTSNEPITFACADDYGNASFTTVGATSVSADGTSLTVRVPVNAVTGRVGLSRETAGLFLQIVPTVSAVDPASGFYRGGTVVVTGRGFLPGLHDQTLATFGPSPGFAVEQQAYYYGFSSLSFSVPTDATTGPITITTLGGTSAPLGGTLAGLTATALTGTPLDPLQPSANRGQTVTVTGTGLSTSTRLLYRVGNGSGGSREQSLVPDSAAADGLSLTFVVPSNAVTGLIELIGDATPSTFILQIV